MNCPNCDTLSRCPFHKAPSDDDAVTVLQELPVDSADRAMVNLAVTHGNWSIIQRWLRFRIDAAKNYPRTLKVARVWWWNNPPAVETEFGRLLMEWVKQNGSPS